MSFLPFVEGMMPVQLLIELAFLFGALALFVRFLEHRGHEINKLIQALSAFAVVFVYFTYRLYPRLPFSMLAMIYVVAGLGIWGWVSSNETYWNDFRRPILAVSDGKTAGTRAVRAVMVVLLPLLVGAWVVTAFMPLDPDKTAPIELRAYHPAPPTQITVFAVSDHVKLPPR